jgi:formylglycine-generating enzyme
VAIAFFWKVRVCPFLHFKRGGTFAEIDMRRLLLIGFVLAAMSRVSAQALDGKLGISWIRVEGGPGGEFLMSATEVTFDQYDAFCEATGREKPKDRFGRGKNPVINVNVADAVAFCDWMSRETGKTVRLPEENEWEFAAKGGSKGHRYEYSGSNDLDEVGWYDANSGKRTHEVATKKPNELGLYDMNGNVWELSGTAVANVNLGGSWYSSYGGSWYSSYGYCRVSSQNMHGASYRSGDIGFRLLQK